jgi:hypothetical protein
MPADRAADRHTNPSRVIRPDPPALWQQLAGAVGPRGRSALVSDLIRRYLAGEPMPPRRESQVSHKAARHRGTPGNTEGIH